MTQHVERPSSFISFKCNPDNVDFQGKPKKVFRLLNSGLIGVGLQIVLEGGETNRHAHNNEDAVWLVLEGRARFYGHTDEERFELGPQEGLLIPMGLPYWFESASPEPLKILRIAAVDKDAPGGRTNYDELKAWQRNLAIK